MVKDIVKADDEYKIKCCISKLHYFLENKDKLDTLNLNSVLDDLVVINCSNVAREDKFVCIQLCCSLVIPSDTILIGKCSQVILRFIVSEQLPEQITCFVVQWCIQALTKSPDISQAELLTVLEHILKTNINTHKQLIDSVLRILKDPLENNSKLMNPGEILLQRLNCILAIIPSISINQIPAIKDIVLQIIRSDITADNILKPEILLVELEIIQMISEKSLSWLSDNIGIVLGIALAFSSYGLPHHVTSIPQYLLPTPLLYPEGKPTTSKNSNKNKNRRKQKKNTMEKIKSAPLDDIVLPGISWSQTSESDFSDSEASRNMKSKKQERKVRLSALSLLLHIIKNIGKKELAGYWNNILSGPYSLLGTLAADTSPRSRVAITSVLCILFSTGKIYISQAQQSSKSNNLPYVSWSNLLADLIVSTHEALCDIVTQSQAVISVLSVLQCVSVLIRNTPYHRLQDGILRKVVYSVCPLLKHLDSNVRIGAIKCITEVVILEPNTEEQILLLRSNDTFENTPKSTDSWIVLYCLESLKNDKLSITVRAECWSLLSFLAKHHFITNVCGQRLKEILEVLERDLQDSNVMLQQKAAKAFEQLAVPIGSLDISCGVDCYKVWLSMLQGPLIPMLQSTSGILSAAAADCIANITALVFEKLPERLRIFIMTILFGCVEHEDHLARSAAVRTLGTIVVFPFLSEDIQIIYDVADRIVCAMKDENLSVRMKAAWALGNLSDVLVAGRELGIPIEEVPLIKVLDMAIQTGSDHEKVKACSMRAIGNLLLLIEKDHLQVDQFKVLTERAADTLMDNASNENNMKVRWNACYSLGNMLKNSLLIAVIDTGWHVKVFETLSKLIVACSNFKVRQAASSALSIITVRETYGDFYHQLWFALLTAFENSQNLPDFSEYKHQRNLIDQLCLTFCHLSTLIGVDDLDHVNSALSNFEPCKKYVSELKKRNLETTVKFEDAVRHLANISRLGITSEQITVTNSLIDIFSAHDTGRCAHLDLSEN